MLHLFKKTYIAIDSFIDSNIDRVVISKVTGTDIHSDIDVFFKGKLYAFGKSLDDVIGEGLSFNNFISFLDFCYEHNTKTNKKIVIYCDKETFMKILSLWYKLILRSPNKSDAFVIIKSYINKQIYYTEGMRPNDQQIYESLDFQELEFGNVFDSAQLTDSGQAEFLDKIKNYLSLELYLASFYFDGSMKTELKSILKTMLLRQLHDLSKDIWKIISTNISNRKFRELMNCTNSYGLSNYTEALYDSRFNSLRNFGAHIPDNDHWSSVHTLPDVNSLSDSQIEEIKNQILQCHYFTNNGMYDVDVMTFDVAVKRNLDLYFKVTRSSDFSDEELLAVIGSNEMTMNLEKIWSPVDRQNVNIYLVDLFVELKHNSQQSLLAGYVLK